jgi:hypothetical protein
MAPGRRGSHDDSPGLPSGVVGLAFLEMPRRKRQVVPCLDVLRPEGGAPTVRSIPAQGKPASRAPPWVSKPKAARAPSGREESFTPVVARDGGVRWLSPARARHPNVPSAPIGRTAMGRLTQGGAREAGLPWAGIPAHRWCGRGHQTCKPPKLRHVVAPPLPAIAQRRRGGGVVRMRPSFPWSFFRV